MLVGMAGFLVMGLAIPHAFGRDGVALGIGYLVVVVVHAWLYQRVNAEHRAGRAVQPGRRAADHRGRGGRGLGRLRAVGGRAGRRAALPAVHPGARPVRHPAVALRRTARGAGHRGVRRVGGGHRARRRRPRRDRVPGAVGGAGAGAGRRAVVGLLRRRRRRAGRAGHAGRGPGGAPGAGPGRVLLRLHPHAARRRRPGLGGQAGHREHRAHAAGRAVRGPGLRGGAVPGRQRGVPARAADRAAVPAAGRGGRVAGRLGGRRGGQRGGRDRAADADRGGRARGAERRGVDTVEA